MSGGFTGAVRGAAIGAVGGLMGGWSLALWSNGYRAASASAGANSALLAAVAGSTGKKQN